jgi:hypothetical protein
MSEEISAMDLIQLIQLTNKSAFGLLVNKFLAGNPTHTIGFMNDVCVG